jgi:hypothetical protein
MLGGRSDQVSDAFRLKADEIDGGRCYTNLKSCLDRKELWFYPSPNWRPCLLADLGSTIRLDD